MKVSDLINKLTKTMETFGDIPIVVDGTDDEGDFLMVVADKVDVCEWESVFIHEDLNIGDKFLYIRKEYDVD